jgi:predicted PhzF superfamily epimerase YddE/YHI9
LAIYWQKKLNKKSFVAYQASARGGTLYLDISEEDGRLWMGGNAVTTLVGRIKIPK